MPMSDHAFLFEEAFSSTKQLPATQPTPSQQRSVDHAQPSFRSTDAALLELFMSEAPAAQPKSHTTPLPTTPSGHDRLPAATTTPKSFDRAPVAGQLFTTPRSLVPATTTPKSFVPAASQSPTTPKSLAPATTPPNSQASRFGSFKLHGFEPPAQRMSLSGDDERPSRLLAPGTTPLSVSNSMASSFPASSFTVGQSSSPSSSSSNQSSINNQSCSTPGMQSSPPLAAAPPSPILLPSLVRQSSVAPQLLLLPLAEPEQTASGGRRIPGPAGLLPPLRPGEQIPRGVVASAAAAFPAVGAVDFDSPVFLQSDFLQGAWLQMLETLALPPFDDKHEPPQLLKYNIDYVLRYAFYKKVPQLIVLVKTVNTTDVDTTVLVCDPTASMEGSLHNRVLQEHSAVLTPGAVMVLRNVSVFNPTPVSHYLNITCDNIALIIPADAPHSRPPAAFDPKAIYVKRVSPPPLDKEPADQSFSWLDSLRPKHPALRAAAALPRSPTTPPPATSPRGAFARGQWRGRATRSPTTPRGRGSQPSAIDRTTVDRTTIPTVDRTTQPVARPVQTTPTRSVPRGSSLAASPGQNSPAPSRSVLWGSPLAASPRGLASVGPVLPPPPLTPPSGPYKPIQFSQSRPATN